MAQKGQPDTLKKPPNRKPTNLSTTSTSASTIRHRTKSAIVYDPSKQTLSTEPIEGLLGTEGNSRNFVRKLTLLGNRNFREVPLPHWSNQVKVFLDEKETEFLARIYLDSLGTKKNFQRRIGRNFTRLFIKGSNNEQIGHLP